MQRTRYERGLIWSCRNWWLCWRSVNCVRENFGYGMVEIRGNKVCRMFSRLYRHSYTYVYASLYLYMLICTHVYATNQRWLSDAVPMVEFCMHHPLVHMLLSLRYLIPFWLRAIIFSVLGSPSENGCRWNVILYMALLCVRDLLGRFMHGVTERKARINWRDDTRASKMRKMKRGMKNTLASGITRFGRTCKIDQ